ncbi:MAG: dienelactone hydrolase family protein [Cyclobacteriaceae bacterium]|nr:dienelactone hydrolase family protein [Cyclobacteriaceae bacterium]
MKNLLHFLLLCPLTLWAQDPLKRLEESPRHHEWVNITYGDRTVKSFLVYPEVSAKVPVVIVIHENKGLNDWARSMADQIAEAGYIAIAPDLLSGDGPDGGGTSSFTNSDDARTAIYALTTEKVTADLNATADFAKQIPAGNGKIAVIGFCWGGSQSFEFATNNTDIKAAFVCYGTGPKDPEAYKRIKAPVYGFYGGNDNRVNATIEESKKQMEVNGKTYEPVIYEGAGHGFFRAGEADNATEANKKGREEGMKRLLKLLSEI